MEQKKIDLHMHSSVSDGTDAPKEILEKVRNAGIGIFALTDHDDIMGCMMIENMLGADDPVFIPGVEFSCRDEDGKYHILGYGYDSATRPILDVLDEGHLYRMDKLNKRLDFIASEFGFTFPDKEVDKLHALSSPGKPHIANLMVKYGYAADKKDAIDNYLNKKSFSGDYVRPEDAIKGILGSGGIPVLAHPAYGSGDQLILGAEMDARLKKLIGFGLQGMETFYSGFTPKIEEEMIGFAEKYDLYMTAGSDYHGKNKLIPLGDTNLSEDRKWPEGLARFIKKMVG
ncbi:MAG: PHP domain-containing protein [Lachnospiraceae bacterium]|nr:PHP domain-containing protein [Lachnospiraceae bacterium]